MARTGQRQTGGVVTAAVVMAVVLSGPPGLAAAAAQPPDVVLHIDNRVNVRPQDLMRARAEVERIFLAAGVRTAWVERPLSVAVSGLNAAGGSSLHLGALLIDNSGEPTRGATACALGLAMPATATAYVYVNRLVETSSIRPVDMPVVLGRVLAHEFGHLLLPRGSHSRFGIMRADLDLGYGNPEQFIESQVRQIRDRLSVTGPRLSVAGSIVERN